jgi:hypothetical protein
MPWVRFEFTIPVLDRAKTFLASDRATTVIGKPYSPMDLYSMYHYYEVPYSRKIRRDIYNVIIRLPKNKLQSVFYIVCRGHRSEYKYITRRFKASNTNAYYRTLYSASTVRLPSLQPPWNPSLLSSLIFHDLGSSRYSENLVRCIYACLIAPILSARPTYHSVMHFTVITTWDEVYKLRSSSACNILLCSYKFMFNVSKSFIGNTCNLHSFLKQRHPLPHACKIINSLHL